MKGIASRKLTGDQVDEIARRYRRGESVEALAVAFRCSTSPIRNALRMRSVPMRKGYETTRDRFMRLRGQS